MKDLINFEDLMKVDVRMGQVIEAEKVEGADRLIKMKVDFGEEIGTKIVVAAVAHKGVTESKLIKEVFPFVLNLEPRKIRGIESQAMILMAENSNGDYISLIPGVDNEEIIGSKVL